VASLAFAAVVFVVAAANRIRLGRGLGPGNGRKLRRLPWARRPFFDDRSAFTGRAAGVLPHLQLTLFRDQQRQSARMSPIAAALSDSDVRQLSAYFAALPPAEPADGQDKAQAGRR